jgi:hypothetical protein
MSAERRPRGLGWAAFACVLAACSGLGAAQEPASAYKLLLLTMRASAESHDVIAARVVESAVPLHLDAPTSSPSVLNFSVVDGIGATLLEGSVENPLVVRSPLPEPGKPIEGHAAVSLEQSEYLLRLPYDERMRYLKLWFGRKPASGSAPTPGGARAASAQPEPQTIDLKPWLGTP